MRRPAEIGLLEVSLASIVPREFPLALSMGTSKSARESSYPLEITSTASSTSHKSATPAALKKSEDRASQSTNPWATCSQHLQAGMLRLAGKLDTAVSEENSCVRGGRCCGWFHCSCFCNLWLVSLESGRSVPFYALLNKSK